MFKRKTMEANDVMKQLEVMYITETVGGGASNEIRSNNVKKELKFMHITKTGGTSIELDAKKKGILWGRYDPNFIKNKYKVVDSGVYGCFMNNMHNSIIHAYNYEELINKYDWFTIVRNPYSKLVSLINHYTTHHAVDNFMNLRNPSDVRLHIIDYIKNHDVEARCSKQSVYVYDENGHKFINHVLYFENLTEDFNSLMEEYNIDLKLVTKFTHNTDKSFSVKDLTPDIIRAVNEIYKDDFINFKYYIMDPDNIDFDNYKFEHY